MAANDDETTIHIIIRRLPVALKNTVFVVFLCALLGAFGGAGFMGVIMGLFFAPFAFIYWMFNDE